MTHDDLVEEIHAYRAELYERFGGDAEAIFHYYQEREPQNAGRRSTVKGVAAPHTRSVRVTPLPNYRWLERRRDEG